MLSTKSSNFEIFSERTSSIQRNVKLKDRDSFFSFFLRSPCMKSVSYEKGTSRREEEHSLYQYVCRLSVEKPRPPKITNIYIQPITNIIFMTSDVSCLYI